MAYRRGGGQGHGGGQPHHAYGGRGALIGGRGSRDPYGGRRAPTGGSGGWRAPTGLMWPPPSAGTPRPPTPVPCTPATSVPPVSPYTPATAVTPVSPSPVISRTLSPAASPFQPARVVRVLSPAAASFKPARVSTTPTPTPWTAFIPKELQQNLFCETALAPPSVAAVEASQPIAEKAPEVDLAPVSKKGLLLYPDSLFHYDICINPEPKSRQTNREVPAELIKVHGKTSLGGKLPAYDGRKSLYAAGSLPFESEELSITLVDFKKKEKERAEREYKITIRIAGRIDLYHLQQFHCGIQSQILFTITFGHRGDGEGLERWRDVSATSFFKPVTMIQFVQEFFNLCDMSRPLNDRGRVKVVCVARNVACIVRGGFFREFDENLLNKVRSIQHENELLDLPYAPDVADNLVCEDTNFVPANKDPPPIPEGMSGAEVEKRLNGRSHQGDQSQISSSTRLSDDARVATRDHLAGSNVQSNGGSLPITPLLFVSVLQEIGRLCNSTVEFRSTVSTSRSTQFSVEVLFGNEKVESGVGKPQEAQVQAAEKALQNLQSNYLTLVADMGDVFNNDTNKSPGSGNGFLHIVDSDGDISMEEPSGSTSEQKGHSIVDRFASVISLIREHCLEDQHVVFRDQVRDSGSAINEEYHLQVELAGQILGNGTGVNKDLAKLQIKKALRGGCAQTNHQEDQIRRYKRTELPAILMSQLIFPVDKRTMRIQYFTQRYNYNQHHTDWPCLHSGSDARPVYLPMEACRIVEGQRYSKKLDDKQVMNILRATSQRPQQREQSICELRYYDSGREKICAPSVGQLDMINKISINPESKSRRSCSGSDSIPVNIIINTPVGTLSVDVPLNSCCYCLKYAIEIKIGVEINNCTLRYGGQVIQYSQALEYYGIKNLSVLHLGPKMRGGSNTNNNDSGEDAKRPNKKSRKCCCNCKTDKQNMEPNLAEIAVPSVTLIEYVGDSRQFFQNTTVPHTVVQGSTQIVEEINTIGLTLGRSLVEVFVTSWQKGLTYNGILSMDHFRVVNGRVVCLMVPTQRLDQVGFQLDKSVLASLIKRIFKTEEKDFLYMDDFIDTLEDAAETSVFPLCTYFSIHYAFKTANERAIATANLMFFFENLNRQQQILFMKHCDKVIFFGWNKGLLQTNYLLEPTVLYSINNHNYNYPTKGFGMFQFSRNFNTHSNMLAWYLRDLAIGLLFGNSMMGIIKRLLSEGWILDRPLRA